MIKKFLSLIFLSTIIVISLMLYFQKDSLADYVKTVFSPTVLIGGIENALGLKSTDNRTNFLILGVDTRSEDSVINSKLTDAIMVLSLDNNSGDVDLISIPRDLWIPSKGYKINAIYTISKGNIEEIKEVASNVVGLDIHYYAIVNFEIFTDLVDGLGGITVDVPNEFTDNRYPIEGRENAPEDLRYETVTFESGQQLMDGETALKYARSRHATEYIEAGDFARARRQQIVLKAIKEELINTESIFDPSRYLNLYTSYIDNIETDFKLPQATFFIKNIEQLGTGKINSIILSSEPKTDELLGSGLLRSNTSQERETLHRNQFVLLPKSNTYDEIHVFIRSQLFEQNVTSNQGE